jgi:hypothetical protein
MMLCYCYSMSSQVDELAVFIELSSISSANNNFVEILRAIPPEVIRKKQLAIQAIAPKLQYSIVSNCLLFVACCIGLLFLVLGNNLFSYDVLMFAFVHRYPKKC